ncbi:MAG: hypothetical protein A2275_02755 [Bacteroidetes bacterium RIFOXYA12_FULL_35_11]|nr:MAG: hypothetical protein A2X01_21205 [Bacteroidetes bacterium GWF2_35_48]OFY80931.1 MAG: hypothetical protein A2275_02755 [Bacteroidetes bacterium RIFOXYA12_FULL_35_11]OFY91969.1 MAG: hypothetical protein A2309_00455 [Bacteroidetes bacterium RIFOXYB2_FULL_35_7]OFZ01474.1 MAG: hypothetical protein A2491_21665 [Bacteroidetes bacterium RIFOXYC12_FULL_35_7]
MAISFLIFLLFSALGFAQQRFPKPDFESGYVPPETQVPSANGVWMEYLDVFIFILLLSLFSYFILKKRSRKFVIWGGVFSVVYFGFFREGCVCSIGAIQNVALALYDSSFVLPLTVIVFFLLPLFFTLFFGRTFCAGVCMFGALQEVVIYKPVKISSWLQKALGAIPYLYLTFAILFAVTGADFIICKYDPFVGFFRFSTSPGMFAFGVGLLLLGMFVARPYCRFICPYGVLLSWVSQISVKHLTITPTDCIQCKLCEDACPVDAIAKPSENVKPESKGTRRLIFIFVLIPVFMLLFGFITSRFYEPLSMVHPQVRLAEEIALEKKINTKPASVEAVAFNSSGMNSAELFKLANEIRITFYRGSWIAGLFLGFIFGLALLQSSRFKRNTIYTPDKGSCVGCARCFRHCPVERKEG